MRDVLPHLERWVRDGTRAALASVVQVERSAPRQPGAMLAVSERGEVIGSVTGGCVEPAVYQQAEEVLAGGAPRLVSYGITDEEGFAVGLSCGGTVHIFIEPLDPAVIAAVSEAVATDQPLAVVTAVEGAALGERRLVRPGDVVDPEAVAMLTCGETGLVGPEGARRYVASFVPRPAMYVFGAIDHASALARLGRFLGYRVTVCDAREKFVTPERFPDVDDLVVDWPHRFLAAAPVDERTAICVLTHDVKFDVPVLEVALRTPAEYIGAMGSRRTTEARNARLRAAGVDEDQLARIHAPIGLPIGARTPQEVAVAVAAELVAVTRRAGVFV
jgi:xanthine dehydrogenase accessory factor